MKKIYLSLILVAGILSSLVSCSDDLLDPVAAKGDAIVLSAPTGGTYALSASTASATAFTVKWTSSTFGYSAAARYTLQVIKSTGNFSAPGTFPLLPPEWWRLLPGSRPTRPDPSRPEA